MSFFLRKKRQISIFRKAFLSESNAYRLSLFGIVLFFLFVLLNFICGDWNFTFLGKINEEKIGQFGDFVGGVIGSLFALVGVILYYVALKEQRKDLKMNQNSLNLQTEALNQQVEEFKAQEKELRETREVYEKQTKLFEKQTLFYEEQAKEYKKQTKVLALQQFESSFFSLIKLLAEQQGKFFNADGYLFEQFIDRTSTIGEKMIQEKVKDIDKSFETKILQKSVYLENYTQVFFRVLNLLKETEIERKNKMHYLKILQSQLTKKEMILLFYYTRTRATVKDKILMVRYKKLFKVDAFDKLECVYIDDFFTRNLLSYFYDQMGKITRDACSTFKELDYTDNSLIKNETINLGSEKIDFQLILTDEAFSATLMYGKYVEMFDDKTLVSLTEFLFYDIFFLSKYKQLKENAFAVHIEVCQDLRKVSVISTDWGDLL